MIRAIELNGVAVELNKKAFMWGRRSAHDPEAVNRIAFPADVIELKRISSSLDEMIERRAAFLTSYQNKAYADRYRELVAKARVAESKLESARLTEAVARYAFKLMAYKDEYEVARLYTDGSFMAKIRAQFEGDYKLKFHLAPPTFSRRNHKGELVKREFGSWMFGVFKLLAALRALRGTPFDIFGYSAERRQERALIGQYEDTLSMMLAKLSASNLDAAVALASVPEDIRGYGHVKEAHVQRAMQKRDELLAAFKAPVTAINVVRAA
jgi:indolepyruvate ferredoxin oxidoreductase